MSKKQQRVAVAVDLGATNLRTALVREDGKILKKLVVATPKKGRSGRVVTEKFLSQIKKLLRGYKGDVIGIGVSSAGPISVKKGTVHAHNIGYKTIPIVEPLKKTFHLSVAFYNDTNAAVQAIKKYGEGRRSTTSVYITISTGLGGGVMDHGHVLIGRDGNAAEIGHLHVETAYKLECSCKKGYGHWEGCASGMNIPIFFTLWADRCGIEKPGFRPTNTKAIFTAARKKNVTALQFMEELGRVNGRGLSNVIAAYEPDLIAIGGAVVENNKDLFLRYTMKYIDPYLVPLPKIVVTKLGDEVSLLGAAAAIFEEEK